MPTLGQIIAAVGNPPEWRASNPEDIGIGGGGFFEAGVKDYHFYNDGVEFGVINDETSANTGFGVGALSVVALSGSYDGQNNTAVGYNALMTNDGAENVAVGSEALLNNLEGEYNIAIGAYALHENLQGDCNIAVGDYALYRTVGTTGFGINDWNIAVGMGAMENFLQGENNIAIGHYAFSNYGTGDENIVIGNYNSLGSLLDDVYTDYNICVGSCVLNGWRYFDGYGENVIVGSYAVTEGYTVGQNVVMGHEALDDGWNNTLNVIVGYRAFYSEEDYYLRIGAADCNVAVGAFSGRNVANLHYTVFLGYDTSVPDPISNTIGYTYYNITPATDGLFCKDYYYGITFVFDDGSESNILAVCDTYYGSGHCSPSYYDEKIAHWEIRLTSIPLHTATFSPKICVARNIYRILERDYPNNTPAVDREYNWFNWGRWGLVGTISNNSTTTFNDRMSQTVLETQPLLLGPSMSIALGAKAQITNANQLVVGGGAIYPADSPANGIKEAFFGNGVFAVAPMDFTLNATGGFGEDVGGARGEVGGER